MIVSFKCKDTKKLMQQFVVKRFLGIEQQALRKLIQLDAAASLDFLKIPPGNKLEKLGGDRKEQYSIRINNRWRLCFEWLDGNAYEVEIVDYH